MSKNDHIQLSLTKDSAARKIFFKRLLATIIMLSEALTQAFWPLTSWLLFFCGLWLMNLPAIGGATFAIILWLGFISGAIYFIRKALRDSIVPQSTQIDRRLEQDSGFIHRPLQAIKDRMASTETPSSGRLWIQNKLDAFQTISRIKTPKPKAIISKYDHYAIRFIALFTFIIGTIYAGPYAGERIIAGLTPFQFGKQATVLKTASLTILPPEYTNLSAINIVPLNVSDAVLPIPQGSTIKAKVTDGLMSPKLYINGEVFKLEELGAKSWSFENTLPDQLTPNEEGQFIELKQWPRTLIKLPYQYIVDQPPVITQDGEIDIDNKAQIHIPLITMDDYGVVQTRMHVELDSIIDQTLRGGSYEETRPLFSAPEQEFKFESDYDLAWHPWAGLPVSIHVEVSDHNGQIAALEPIKMKLPERIFTHPVAKELIEVRQQLIWQDETMHAERAEIIEDFIHYPDLLDNDPVTALALQSAASRLRYHRNEKDIISVIELLWDIAIKLEDGNIAQAAQNLQVAQKNLQDLLANPNATDEQIAQAMDELRQAMSAFMLEAFKEYQKELAAQGHQQELPLEMFENMMNPQDLDSFLDQILSKALTGDRQSAQEMLSQLENFMDQMSRPESFELSPQMKFQMKGMSDLQRLIEQQEKLLDQTTEQHRSVYRQSIEQKLAESVPFKNNSSDDKTHNIPELDDWDMPPPSASQTENPQAQKKTIDTSAHKAEQDALRYALGQLMIEADEKLGEIPKNMQDAEKQMRLSADALGDNKPGRSIPHQERTIELLKEAMNKMSKDLQKSLQNMALFSFGPQRLDPLGRPFDGGDQNGNGNNPASGVGIPDQMERKKIQDILNTLRKKSGEFERPEYELDYYRRLMQQF